MPRATHDIDVVISGDEGDVEAIVAAFPHPDYYTSRHAVKQAVRGKGMFNIIETRESSKVDFWILTDGAFDQSRFARRIREKMAGTEANISSPEDTILQKLVWVRLSGGSEKAFGDALLVYEVQYPRLDMGYLERWADTLGLGDMWGRLQQEAEPVEDE